MSVPMNWIRFSSIRWTSRLILLVLLLLIFPPDGFSGTPILRKVLVLYNSETSQDPIKNIAFECCQTVLNYYGVLADYRDVKQRPLPEPGKMSRYRGVITVFNSGEMRGPREYLTWLNRQFDAGKKVVVLNQLGGTAKSGQDPLLQKLINQVFHHMGLKYGGEYTSNKALIRYVYKDKKMVEFERKCPVFPPAYEKFIPLGADVDTYLSIRRKDKKNSTSSVIVTSPTGGFAMEDYIFWQDSGTFRKQWYLNPFLFFEKALGLKGLPRPDPTTLNGLRVAFSHIDGDAFGGPSRIDKKSLCAEIIRDRILKKYDFPVTVSVIAGEIDPKAMGNSRLVRIAREIYKLPNVEPASHSYSHPFYWDPEYKHKDWYDHQYGIKIPGYSHDPKKEIDHSMKYITEELAPPGRPCKVLLWSGNCEPTESDIARCDALGALNMNGGDTIFDNYNESYSSVAPLYRRVGSRYQVFIGQVNENILTDLWKGPYYGYREIITTMKRTGYPRRIKPIDIYYHFYSGEYPASLKALRDVYEWVMKQTIAPVFSSDYIRMVLGFIKARIKMEKPGHYIIEDYDHCLTIRFDSEQGTPDLGQCQNVLGYVREPQGLYVSLAPEKERAVIVLSKEGPASKGPFLKEASGWVTDFDSGKQSIRLNFKGFGKGSIVISGLTPGRSFEVQGTAVGNKPRWIESDEKGGLSLKGLGTGTVGIKAR